MIEYINLSTLDLFSIPLAAASISSLGIMAGLAARDRRVVVLVPALRCRANCRNSLAALSRCSALQFDAICSNSGSILNSERVDLIIMPQILVGGV